MAIWTATNGAGICTVTDKINLSIAADGTAASLYPSSNNPRATRDISEYTYDECNFNVTARVVSASLHADSRLSFAIADETLASGMIVFIDQAGVVGVGPWDNAGDAGTEAAACPLDGTGWVRIAVRAGLVTASCGTGTTTTPPRAWHTTQTGRPRGCKPFTTLVMYLTKWAGANAAGAFDRISIQSFKDL